MYGTVGKQVLLYEGYLEQLREEALQESANTSDFPTYLAGKIVRRFLTAFREVQPAWQQYAYVQNLPDFRSMSSVGLGELPDLLPIPEDGEYSDSAYNEYTGPTLQLGTFGRSFSIGRRLIVNDDLGKLNDIPARFGRAVRRTLAKQVVAVIVSNVTAYDGVALFHASHNNLFTTALSEASVQTAISMMRVQTDQNGLRVELKPKYLLHPIDLAFTVARVLNGTTIPWAGSGATPAYGQTEVYPLRMVAALEHIEDPYLTDANDYYLLAEPSDSTAVVTVGFLNGKSEPDIMLKDPGMRLVLGGNDPYSFQFDRIEYKVRHDWAVGAGEWRGAVKASVP